MRFVGNANLLLRVENQRRIPFEPKGPRQDIPTMASKIVLEVRGDTVTFRRLEPAEPPWFERARSRGDGWAQMSKSQMRKSSMPFAAIVNRDEDVRAGKVRIKGSTPGPLTKS